MSWNYRVVKNHYEEGGEYLAIHEVYYDENGDPTMCSVLPAPVVGDDDDFLKSVLNMMQQAFDRPVLDYDKDFPTDE